MFTHKNGREDIKKIVLCYILRKTKCRNWRGRFIKMADLASVLGGDFFLLYLSKNLVFYLVYNSKDLFGNILGVHEILWCPVSHNKVRVCFYNLGCDWWYGGGVCLLCNVLSVIFFTKKRLVTVYPSGGASRRSVWYFFFFEGVLRLRVARQILASILRKGTQTPTVARRGAFTITNGFKAYMYSQDTTKKCFCSHLIVIVCFFLNESVEISRSVINILIIFSAASVDDFVVVAYLSMMSFLLLNR